MNEPGIDTNAVRDTPKRTTLSGRRFGRISMAAEMDEARERERATIVNVLASDVDDRWEIIARRSTGSRRRVELRGE
ncbi:MAG: hypothetical protein JWM95_1130 [Gemmatimonadetes bacterium]|nr:hypothetical protein [Gemmatimonadota bacterium]